MAYPSLQRDLLYNTRMKAAHAKMLAVASEAALNAGALPRGVFFDRKRDDNAFENADLAAEDLIYEHISHEFPEMGIRMEERPERNQHPVPAVNTLGLSTRTTAQRRQKLDGAERASQLAAKGDMPVLVAYAYAYPDNEGDLPHGSKGVAP